jgi:hypothetical protein
MSPAYLTPKESLIAQARKHRRRFKDSSVILNPDPGPVQKHLAIGESCLVFAKSGDGTSYYFTDARLHMLGEDYLVVDYRDVDYWGCRSSKDLHVHFKEITREEMEADPLRYEIALRDGTRIAVYNPPGILCEFFLRLWRKFED